MKVNCCVWADGTGEGNNACKRRAVSSPCVRLWEAWMTDEIVTVDLLAKRYHHDQDPVHDVDRGRRSHMQMQTHKSTRWPSSLLTVCGIGVGAKHT